MSASLPRLPAGTHGACATGAIALALALQSAAPIGQVMAQEVAVWHVECTGDGKVLDCRAVQQLLQRKSRQLLISMQVRKGQDAKSATVTMQLPLGLNLTEPIQLKVDNGPPEKQPIQTCTSIGCFIVFTANEKLITAMRGGTELKIAVQDINKRSIELALPLLGFGIAFDKARS